MIQDHFRNYSLERWVYSKYGKAQSKVQLNIIMKFSSHVICLFGNTRAAPDSPTYKWQTNVIDDTTSVYNAQRDHTNWWRFNMAASIIGYPLAECIFWIYQSWTWRFKRELYFPKWPAQPDVLSHYKLFTMTRYGDWPPVAHAYPCTEVTVMGNNELTLWCQLISVDVSTRWAISDGILCTHMFSSNSCDKKNPMIAIYQKVSMAITTAVPKFSESTLCFIINLHVLAHKWTHSWRD